MSIKSSELIRIHLLAGNLERAADALQTIPEAEHYPTLDTLAVDKDDEESIGFAVYGLVAYMIGRDSETPHWHGVASLLTTSSLCWLPGAYALGYFHARQAAQMRPEDVDAQEFVLFFAKVPDPPMSKEEARQQARLVLARKPDSEIAQQFVAEHKP